MKKSLATMLLIFAATALVGCGNKPVTPGQSTDSSNSVAVNKVTVTLDLNYAGSTAQTVEVEVGSTLPTIETPTRTGFTFDGWYSDKECTNRFDLSTPITEAITIYAAWLDASKTYFTVTLDLNYEGAPAASTLKVEQGGYVILPTENPTREGYEFVNWFTEKECTNKFRVVTQVTENFTLYAGWTKQHVFEAEYISTIEDMVGPGYSGTATGLELIQKDKTGEAKASNGYWVTYLYARNVKLEYVINSDVAVEKVKMVLRLSAEVMDISVTCEEWQVLVNDEKVLFPTISITDVPKQGSGKVKEFADFTISKEVSLKAGENKISLVTMNDRAMFGTMSATAPMVDCMKLTTDANLTWNPALDNIQ